MQVTDETGYCLARLGSTDPDKINALQVGLLVPKNHELSIRGHDDRGPNLRLDFCGFEDLPELFFLQINTCRRTATSRT